MIKNKNIVLTGCNSGIGLEVLKLLSDGGNKLLCVDKNVNNLEPLASDKIIVMQKDISTQEAVDQVFAKAEEIFDFIDIFYANAGYPYYEEINYCDWDRVKAMFDTNVFSPIYTYQKYIKYLNGRQGTLAITVSAIGEMAMPGFTVYSASKFAMHGFQQAVRLEMPKNLQLTCLYPVATETGFFAASAPIQYKKPFPVQKASVVAKKMVKGIEKGKKKVSPCALFGVSKVLMGICPPVRTVYWALEGRKFKEYKDNIKNNTGVKWDE